MIGDKYEHRYKKFLKKKVTNKYIFAGSSSIDNWRPLHAFFPQLSPGWKGFFFKDKEGKRRVNWKLLKNRPKRNYENYGVGGTKICHLQVYLDRLFVNREGGVSPKKIIIYSGDNDLGTDTAEQIIENYEILIQRIREKGVTTPIYIVATKPSFKRQHQLDVIESIGTGLEETFADQDDVTIINTFDEFFGDNDDLDAAMFASDGLHLSRLAYEMWAEYIQAAWKN
jgi:lysophospholipase L1-like esterase